MKYLTTLLVAVLLAGCASQWQQPEEDAKTPQDWLRAAERHRCSEEAMARAEKETAFCAAHTGHSGAYCYGTAIIRNCKKRVERSDE